MAPAVCVSSIGEGTPSCEMCPGAEQQIRMYSEGRQNIVSYPDPPTKKSRNGLDKRA